MGVPRITVVELRGIDAGAIDDRAQDVGRHRVGSEPDEHATVAPDGVRT
ncbi:MAG TPA: hypothetical protein VGS17_11680 [Candidatus Limnocylindria bacterium]|nr:hypothetical protein [Candidatus Limnocylindria bacterium]